MHKSILKIILIIYFVLHICLVKTEDVNDIEFQLDSIEETNSEKGKTSTGDVISSEGDKTTQFTEVTQTSTIVSGTVPIDITSSFTFIDPEAARIVTSTIEIKEPTVEPKPIKTPNPPKPVIGTPNTIPSPAPTPVPTPVPTPGLSPNREVQPNKPQEEENKIAPVTTLKGDEYSNNNNRGGDINVDNVVIDTGVDNNSLDNGNKNENVPFYEKMGTVVLFVGTVSVGLVAVSGYQVYKRKNEKGLKQKEYVSQSLTNSSLTPSDLSENNPRISISQSLIFDNESQNQAYDMYYSAKSLEEKEQQIEQRIVNVDTLTYQSPKPRPQSQVSIESATSKTASIGRNSLDRNSTGRNSLDRSSLGRNSTRSTISRNSVIRHSFLNPNIRIVRTGKRTQQLFEATNEHPAIIETFPSMERPFEPAVPVPLEESDTNSLHPHSIYQMYQEEMEFENYYAYTIDDKEYIIDPTTNRVLEIHDLTTDEYVLVEEELYLDFSGSDDSDSDKQTI